MSTTTTHEIQGLNDLVAMLDEAVAHDRVEQITHSLQRGLSDLISQQKFSLPEELCQQHGEHYARRLIYRSSEHGYAVVGMTWGPGQGTPLHDHAGVWCVEGVLEGQIEVTQYNLMETRGEHFRFQPTGTVRTGVGSSGSLIPPFEYHVIRNPSDDARSVTLHVYGLEMSHCTIFQPEESNWYQRQLKTLSYDA